VKRARLGLIGAGGIGTTHAHACRASAHAQLVAICDVDAKRATDLAQLVGAEAFDSLLAMNEMSLDGVIVATPPNSHQAIAEYFALRGINVLCEKPFAPSVDAAESMIAVARKSGVLLTMASKFRFVDDVRKARSMIARGAVGELLMIENSFTSSVVMAARWNSDPRISGGGVIIDNGTHALDIFRFFGGAVTDVRATEYRRYQHLAVEDTAVLFARCENGAVATSDLSWSIDKRSDHYLRIHCSEATLELGWIRSRLRRNGDTEWRDFGSGYSKGAAFTALLDNFAGSILGVEEPAVSPEDALASVVGIDQAYRSLDTRASAWA
jgi:predicted dehydrogenase